MRARRALLAATMAAALGIGSGMAPAAEQPAPKPPASKVEPIYGSQLMTQDERNEYRAKMRAAKTREEREALRAEHHSAMQARAKERGVTLPDQPRVPAGPRMRPGAGGGPRDGYGPRPAQ